MTATEHPPLRETPFNVVVDTSAWIECLADSELGRQIPRQPAIPAALALAACSFL